MSRNIEINPPPIVSAPRRREFCLDDLVGMKQTVDVFIRAIRQDNDTRLPDPLRESLRASSFDYMLDDLQNLQSLLGRLIEKERDDG